MSTNHQYTIFMTGVTGFLGHYVLRDLLKRGLRIVAMLREPAAETVARLSAMMRSTGINIQSYIARGQLIWVEGELPDNLPDCHWGPTDAVLNCAASLLLFSNGNGDPDKTNLKGTEALIQWAEQNGVERFYAVSTAYTCGWNRGLICEKYHHPQPEFQTDYERSKWQAEAMLERWANLNGHKLTVFRPSFIVGDSVTGYTTQFWGMYQLARLVSVLKSQYSKSRNGSRTYVPLRIPGRANDPQNIVPVDFVSRVMAEVITNPRYQDCIYHLTNPEPPTNDMIKRCFEDFFGLYGGYFAHPDDVVGKCSSAESLLWDQYHVLTPRVSHNPVFDMSNTREVMDSEGLSFPILDHDRIIKLFEYASACGWRQAGNGNHF
ncbi:MAG: SDR family oxidoreductase [Planctomycetota bacterium]|jgi:nucleoside-diphosphate-sugar epimerase